MTIQSSCSIIIIPSNWHVLYSNLSENDLAMIEDYLNLTEIDYIIRKDNEGNKIIVPESLVYKLRLTLLEKGVPKDSASLPNLEYLKNKYSSLHYQYKELADTLTHFNEIVYAEVNVHKNQTLRTDNNNTITKDTVVIDFTFYPNISLTKARKEKICHLSKKLVTLGVHPKLYSHILIFNSNTKTIMQEYPISANLTKQLLPNFPETPEVFRPMFFD